MASENPRKRGNPIGAAGKNVAKNIKRLRQRAGLDLRAMSALLADIKHPISPSGLSKIENRERRVDVDDLVAMAIALNVSPLTLLLPEYADAGDEQPMTGLTETMYSNVLWLWGIGQEPLFLPDKPGTPRAARAIAEYQIGSRPEIDPRDEFSTRSAARARTDESEEDFNERLQELSAYHARKQGVPVD